MKKILVTGATSFIGSYVIPELLSRGVQVIATSSSREKAEKASWFPQVTYIPFDLKKFDNNNDYFTFFAEPDAMIHLAWEGLPNYKENFHIEENLPRHFNFLSNLIQNGLTDLTATGTCFEYGMKEGSLSEDTECEPANPYAIAKNELRKQLEALRSKQAFHFKWVRLFYMYGEGQGPKSLFSQLAKAVDHDEAIFNMSGGEQVRDFLPVEKVAEYIVGVALQQKVEGAINCCSGEPITVKAFVENYLKKRKKKISLNLGYYPYADYEAMKFWGDNSKLKQILNND